LTENPVCTYEIRRPAQAPTQRIRSLEEHLRYATSFLKELKTKLPDVNDADIDAALTVLDFSEPSLGTPPPVKGVEPKSFKLASMITGCDQLVRDGPWSLSFYGATSGFAFVMRTLELFQKPSTMLVPEARSTIASLFDAPLLTKCSLNPAGNPTLPLHDVAAALVEAVFTRCHPLLQFLEQPDFYDMMNHIYDDLEKLGTSDPRSISLFRLVLALGYLFSTEFHQSHGCTAAVDEAYVDLPNVKIQLTLLAPNISLQVAKISTDQVSTIS
jgi:hypothetical protein